MEANGCDSCSGGGERRRTSYGDIPRTLSIFLFFFTENVQIFYYNHSTICRLETEFEFGFGFGLLFRNFGFLVCSDIHCKFKLFLIISRIEIGFIVCSNGTLSLSLSLSLSLHICIYEMFFVPWCISYAKVLIFKKKKQFLYPNEEKFSNLKMVHEIHTTKINK